MISVSCVAMGQLLARASSSATIYSDITLCSPFVDPALVPRLRERCAAAARSRCVVTLITRRPGAASLHALAAEFRRSTRLIIRKRVHTKAYSIKARQRPQYDEALVTSSNDELGVHIRGTSALGRALLEQLDRSLRRLTTP